METNTPQSGQKISTSVASASCGTLLLLLANNLPDTVPYKSWLIIIIPTLSFLIIAVLKFSLQCFRAYIQKRRDAKMRNQIRGEFETVMKNEYLAENEKNILKNKLIAFEQQNLDSLINEFSSKSYLDPNT